MKRGALCQALNTGFLILCPETAILLCSRAHHENFSRPNKSTQHELAFVCPQTNSMDRIFVLHIFFILPCSIWFL